MGTVVLAWGHKNSFRLQFRGIRGGLVFEISWSFMTAFLPVNIPKAIVDLGNLNCVFIASTLSREILPFLFPFEHAILRY
jgi:hypothetical protein